MLAYIIYPSIQDLRPAVMPRRNVFTAILSFIYAFDTPTGVCPSLHVAYSLGILSVFSKDIYVSRWWKITLTVLVILIALSTAFVKQHSMVDVFAALPLGLLAECLVYGKYWRARWRAVHK
jgi:membrane-associated phospholipid phosphatase